MQKLLGIETMQLIFKGNSGDGLEKEPCENKANDHVPDVSRSNMKDSLALDEDSPTMEAVEVASTTESAMKADIPPEDSVSLDDADGFSTVVLEVVDAANYISEACDELWACLEKRWDTKITEKTDFSDPSSSDCTDAASEIIVPVKEDASSAAKSIESNVNELESASKLNVPVKEDADART